MAAVRERRVVLAEEWMPFEHAVAYAVSHWYCARFGDEPRKLSLLHASCLIHTYPKVWCPIHECDVYCINALQWRWFARRVTWGQCVNEHRSRRNG